MKDKEKQNEEIQNILPHIEVIKAMYGDIDFAKYLYDHNCRIINKDSVVLSRKERQARDYECYNLGYEVGKKEGSKEAAEKIYTFINSFGCHNIKRFKEFLKQFGVEWNNV